MSFRLRPMTFLFLHGPGFNAFAERALLGPLFETDSVCFWNEPSRLRPAGDPFDGTEAFGRWVTSAERAALTLDTEERIFIVSHCLAGLAATAIARSHRDRVAGLVLVAPAFDAWQSFRRVLQVAQMDLCDDQPAAASALGRCADETRALMDPPMREGLPLVLRDTKLLTHYWADPAQLAASAAAQAAPEAQFDVDSLFAVLDDLAHRLTNTHAEAPLTIPTLALFGTRDPIAPRIDQERPLLEQIPDASVVDVDDASHFLHLDRPAFFASVVREWAILHHAPASITGP